MFRPKKQETEAEEEEDAKVYAAREEYARQNRAEKEDGAGTRRYVSAVLTWLNTRATKSLSTLMKRKVINQCAPVQMKLDQRQVVTWARSRGRCGRSVRPCKSSTARRL